MDSTKRKAVYIIRQWSDSSGEQRSSWLRVGVAFVNRDGSLNLLLDAIPIHKDSQLHIRDFVPRTEGAGANGGTEEVAMADFA